MVLQAPKAFWTHGENVSRNPGWETLAMASRRFQPCNEGLIVFQTLKIINFEERNHKHQFNISQNVTY